MKVHEFEKIVNKLGMQTRDTHDRLAWLVHNGETIVRTRRSQGNSKHLPEHLIRQQLKINEKQFAGLISCLMFQGRTILKILTDKGVIYSQAPRVPRRSAAAPAERLRQIFPADWPIPSQMRSAPTSLSGAFAGDIVAVHSSDAVNSFLLENLIATCIWSNGQ